MKGIVAFLPADPGFFDDVLGSLVAGRKVNPETYLADCLRIRRSWWAARRFSRALSTVLRNAGPPQPVEGAGFLRNLRTRLETIDWKPDERTRRVTASVVPDLHLEGRPFFVAEGSAEKVADAVDAYVAADGEGAADVIARAQVAVLDPGLADTIEPEDGPDLSPDLSHRGDLLASLKAIHELARAAREGGSWGPVGSPRSPAAERVGVELPWRAVEAWSRRVPFWIARDVDGIETVCRAAGVPAPACLLPARRLFVDACEAFPSVGESLSTEIGSVRGVGAYVAPEDVADLIEFLGDHGATIIRVAARHGEGPACSTLLRKVKECALWASRHGMGYLEACGVLPPDLDAEEDTAY